MCGEKIFTQAVDIIFHSSRPEIYTTHVVDAVVDVDDGDARAPLRNKRTDSKRERE